jgi:hypothetical protein
MGNSISNTQSTQPIHHYGTISSEEKTNMSFTITKEDESSLKKRIKKDDSKKSTNDSYHSF